MIPRCKTPHRYYVWVVPTIGFVWFGCGPAARPEVNPVGKSVPGFAVDGAELVWGPGGQREIRATVIAARPESRRIAVAFEFFDAEGVGGMGAGVAYPDFRGGTQVAIVIPVAPETQGFRFAGAAVAPKPRGETGK